MDYMAYAYLQTDQDAAAKRVVDELDDLVAAAAAPPPAGRAAADFPVAAIPARYALERGAVGRCREPDGASEHISRTSRR